MIFLIILSFFLDGVLSIYAEGTLFLPLLTIMSLVITGPYIESKKKYYIMAGVMGLMYDIIYTETPFINMIFFIIIAFAIKYFIKYINNHAINNAILGLLIIVIYRLGTYMFLNMLGYIVFDPNELWVTIYSSLITNVIYIVLTSLIISKTKNKKRRKRYSTNVRKNY